MRITVNVASRPFVELRPFFARLRIIMAALLLLAIGLGVAQHVEKAKLAAAESQMNDLRLRTAAAQDEKLKNEARMRQPANAAVLQRAKFLNALFFRKSFSWTAVMMDLENVLPTGVQVSAIQPAITADGEVVIQLRVSGDRDRAIQLVRNLERSTRFLAPKLVGESAQTKEQAATAAAQGAPAGGVDFDIIANYNPLPDFAGTLAKAKKIEKSATTVPTAGAPAAGAGPKRTVRPGVNDGVVLKPFAPVRPNPSGGAPARPIAGPPAPGPAFTQGAPR